MKKLYTFITVFLVSVTLMAQAPASFKYQAVLRDARGNIKANTATSIIISILQGSTTGTAVYRETHSAYTDGYGLINLEIGKGIATIGTFSGINWGTSTYFVKVIVDGVEMGTSQLLSVPYALYANNAGNGFSGSYLDLTNKPVLFDGTWSSLISKPSFSIVALSGSYNDLTNKPILFDGTWTSLTGKPSLSLVATTGSYTNLTNQPVLFDGKWISLIGKPTTVNGFGITDAVTLSGDQTIAGNKTFSGTAIVAIPVNATDAANKAYVDAKTSGSTNGHYVGEIFGGGVVFWIDHTGQHGLICSMIDLSTSQEWSNVSSTLIGVTAQSDWNGLSNSNAIIIQSGHTSSAAKLCLDYTNAEYGTGVYSDWYLPSLGEISHLWNNIYEVQKALETDGNASTTAMVKNYYWSSTEFPNNYACYFDFSYGCLTLSYTDEGFNKTTTNHVRAVRPF